MHDPRHPAYPATVRHAAATGRRATVVSVVAIAGVVMPLWAVCAIAVCWTISLATLAGGGHHG